MTKNLSRHFLALVLLLAGCLALAEPYPGMPDGEGSYEELVEIYDEFLLWLDADTEPDYGSTAVAARRAAIESFHSRLQALAVEEWPREQQVDFLAVRARIDQEHFRLHVTRPWARDPGFYVDQTLYPAFTELPLDGDKLQELRNKLASIPPLMSATMPTLRYSICRMPTASAMDFRIVTCRRPG